MAEIQSIVNMKRLLRKLRGKREKAKKDGFKSVIVGYTANYASIVHEIHHEKSKFLERPARKNRKEMAKILVKNARAGKPLIKAMLVAGLFLQRESQKEVPVRTGNLRASAFTRIENR